MPDGTNIAYEERGAGEPLLLISGQGSDRHGWDLIIDDFAANHRCITWDHRGTGESDKPHEPAYTIEGFAADAMALLDHLAIDRAHAYGISMGGRVCQRLAIAYPERMGAVVLGCTTPGNRHGVRRPADVDAAMANRPDDLEERLRFMAANLVSPEWMAEHPEWLEAMRERLKDPIPAYAQKLHYAASEGHEAWDELPSIARPVLVIHGDNDSINVTPNAYLLAGRIPGAEIRIIAGGRHAFHIEFREEASAAVLEFLAQHQL